MSSANPYYNSNDDDDILEDKPKREEASATAPDASVSREVFGSLQKYIGDQYGNSKLPVEFMAVAELYDAVFNFVRFDPDGPMIAALGEVVNELSDGKLLNVYHLYEAERMIMLGFIGNKFFDSVIDLIDNAQPDSVVGKSPFKGEIHLHLETYRQFFNFQRESAITNYKRACEKLGREVDENLITEGVKSSRNTFARIGMHRPPSKMDE